MTDPKTFLYLCVCVCQFVFARLVSMYQQRASAVTHCRVRTINEVLTCIKLIKMYVWEESFQKKITGMSLITVLEPGPDQEPVPEEVHRTRVCVCVSDIRTTERRILEKAALIQNFSMTISPLVPIIAASCTFIFHTWLRLPLSTTTVSLPVSPP